MHPAYFEASHQYGASPHRTPWSCVLRCRDAFGTACPGKTMESHVTPDVGRATALSHASRLPKTGPWQVTGSGPQPGPVFLHGHSQWALTLRFQWFELPHQELDPKKKIHQDIATLKMGVDLSKETQIFSRKP